MSLCGALPVARADTFLAPVGGKAIVPAPALVACEDPGAGWTVEGDGHALRPPARDDAIGRAAPLRMAPRREDCATPSAVVVHTLVAVGRPPTLDAGQIVVEVDAGRLLLRGHDLRGLGIAWRAGGKQGEDRCVAPEPDRPDRPDRPGPRAPAGASDEACALSIPRGLPADPLAIDLRALPAGAHDAPGAVSFDAEGRRLADPPPLHPARVILDRLVPPDAAVDVSSGVGRLTLPHPEAVATADCLDASCELDGDALVVSDEHGADERLDLRVRLRPRVYLRTGNLLDASPRASLALSRCPVAILSAAPLLRVADQRVVVRVAGRCAADPSLAFTVDGAPARVARLESRGAELLAVLRLPAAPEGEELTVTVLRGSTVVGAARARTRPPVASRARLELPGLGPIDFVPENREARVLLPAAEGAELGVVPVDGAYSVRRDEAARVDYVRGVEGGAGSVALRLAYRDRALPPPLDGLVLAAVDEPVQRPLRVANVPVALDGGGGAAAGPGAPFAELQCGDGNGHTTALQPSVTAAIPYRARDTCRLLLHRERLRAEDGAQALQLLLQIVASDGSPRSEARVERRLVVRAAAEPLAVPLHGVAAAYDRLLVRLSLAADEAHYALPLDQAPGSHELQWSVVAGTERFRAYATSAIPTGLFRVGDSGHSGILTLNAGALMRLVPLSREGREIPIGLEAGVMWLSIAGDTEAAASPHGQVALVTGVGVGVPIANAARAAQTSINFHAWLEYEVSRAVLGQPGNPLGFVFGPSITIGDLGVNF